MELPSDALQTPEKISSDNAVALGSEASAAGKGSVAIGKNAVTGTRYATNPFGLVLTKNIAGDGAVAVGDSSQAATEGSVAVGRNAIAGRYEERLPEKKAYGIAIGDGAKAVGAAGQNTAGADKDDAGLAVGMQAYAAGNGTITMGYKAHAENTQNIIIGSNATTEALLLPSGSKTVHPISSIGIGADAVVKGRFSVAIGTGASVGNGQMNLSTGYGFLDFGGVALGYKSQVDRPGSVGLGSWTRPWRQGDQAAEQTKYAHNKNVIAPFSGQKLYFKDDIGSAQVYNTMGKNSVVNGVVSVGGVYKRSTGGGEIPFLRQIINVADGTEDTDAVNLRQLKAVNDKLDTTSTTAGTALQSWDAQIGGTKVKTVDKDHNTLNFVAGKNVSLTNDSENIKIATSDDVDFNKVTVGGVVIDKDADINAGGKKITNLAAGTEDTNAVNVSQLNGVKTNVTNNTNNITALQSGFTVSNAAGTKQDITLGGATKQNIKFQGEENKIDVAVEADGTAGAKVTVKANPNLGKNIDLSNNSTITAINNSITTLQGGFNVKSGTNEGAIKAGETLEFAGKNYVDTQYDATAKKLTIGLDDATKTKIDNINTTIGAAAKWTIQDSESTPGSKTIDAATPLVVKGADGVTAKVDATKGLQLGLDKTELSNTINNGPVITNVAAKFKVGAESGGDKTVTADKTGTQTIKFTGDGNIIESEVTSDGVKYKVNGTNLNTAITNNTTVQQNKTDITALQSGFTVSNAAGTKQDITLGGATKQNIKFQGEENKIDVAVEADGTAGAKVTVKANPNLGKNIDLSNNSTITAINNSITTLQGGFNVKSGTNEGAIKAGETLEFAGKNYVDTQYDATAKKLTIGLDDATKTKIDNINTTIGAAAKWTIQDSESTPGSKTIDAATPLVVKGADGVTAKVDATKGLQLGLDKTELSNTINNGPVITNVAAKFKVGAESGGDKTVTADKTGTQTIKFTGDGNIIESEVTSDGVKYKVNGTNLNTAITNNTTVQQNKTDITALQSGFTVSNAAGTKQDITLGGATKQNIKFQGEENKIDVAVEADGTAGAKVTVKANPNLGKNIDLSNNSTITAINNSITTLQGGFNVKSGTNEGAIKAGETLEFAGKNYVDTQYDATAKKLTIGLDDATKTKIDNINTTIGAAAKWTIQDSESTPGSKTIDAATPLVVQGADGVTAKVDATKGLQLGLDKDLLSTTINNSTTAITNVKAKFKVGADSGTAKPVTADKDGTQTIKFTGDGNIIESEVTSDGVQYKVNETKLKDTLSNTFAKTDASNLTGDNVTQWREKLGVTDHALSQASAWKLQVNGGSERVIGKDDVVNFVAGSYTEVTATGNDVKIGLNDAAKEKLAKVDTLEGKIKANKVQVTGDDATGVKVADTKEADGSTTYKVSLGEKIKVGGVTMDGAGANRTITGLTNTGLDVAGFATSKRAATEEQLQAAMTQMSANAKATKVKSGDENIVVNKTEGQNEYTVALKKDLNVDSLNAGGTKVNKDGITLQGKDGKPGVAITKDGINAGGQTIRNVKPGEKIDDAATVGQLKDLAGAAGNGLNELGNQIGRLDGRVNKVGAGAAALAALHPVDFDADDKLDVAAGWGHYKGRNAMALGAFYRPDERTMFSLGGTVGNGENMINAGITFKLDKRRGPIHAITSKVQLVQEVTQLKADNDELRKDNAELREQMKEINAKLEKLMAAK